MKSLLDPFKGDPFKNKSKGSKVKKSNKKILKTKE